MRAAGLGGSERDCLRGLLKSPQLDKPGTVWNSPVMKQLIAMSLFSALLLAGCTPRAAPPQAAAPAAAAAQSGCNCAMTFILFFDPGSAALVSKNLAAVRQDANLYVRQVQNPIIVSGGADTQEAGANPGVSLRRARAVAAQLEQDGVAPANITLQDNGTKRPMIPTAPGVAQTMNRYVMIRFPIAPMAAAAPVAQGPYQLRGAVLYQSNAMLVARLGPNGARPLANYVSQISASLAAQFAAAPPQPGVSAALVVGVKPGGAVRTWVVPRAGSLSPALTAQIQSAAQEVPPVAVQSGPIVFALIFNAWGGAVPTADTQRRVPVPAEWTHGASGAETVPDGVFARIWP